MPTLAFDALSAERKGMLADKDWSLCVGAGICYGIMPDWSAVTERILRRAYKSPPAALSCASLVSDLSWSLDSLLQYALNVYVSEGKGLKEFNADLSEALYGELLACAANAGLGKELSALLSDPFKRSPKKLLECEAFLRREFGSTSVMQIADALLLAKEKLRSPGAVLTFNADVLLHTALTLLEIKREYDSSGKMSSDFAYRGIHRSTDRPNGKTPIYHIHGSITPEEGFREARDKLIFPESSYLQLASTVYSWPQTVFLSTAQSSKIVFVGLSMSDPNIRRWLSWCDGYRRAELAQIGASPHFSSQHVWITTPQKDPCASHAQEFGLLHLGVRTGFIPSWDRLGDALKNLLGV